MFFDKIENDDLEWELLSQVELRNVEEVFLNLIEGSVIGIGYYSKLFLRNEDNSFEPSFILNFENLRQQNRIDNMICINPVAMQTILTQRPYLRTLSSKIREKLVFIMPYLSKNLEITAYWGEGFDAMERSEGIYARWYVGDQNRGEILVYNNTPYIKDVTIKGRFICLDIDARIRVDFPGGVEGFYDLKHQDAVFEEQITLMPGCNSIAICYFGRYIQINEGRRLKYCVENMCIADTNQVLCEGVEMYGKKDENGFMKFMVEDSKVRRNLHRNGFFEVEGLMIQADGTINGRSITAFAENWSNYYQKKEQINDICEKSAWTLYIAKRKGVYCDK